MAKSIQARKARQSQPPRPDGFPLFVHQSGGGRWAKKVRGKCYYFGKYADDQDGQKALAVWLEQKDELLAGRVPRPKSDELTLHWLVNAYLIAKRDLLNAGEIASRTFGEYHAVCGRLLTAFGKQTPVSSLTAEDFGKFRAQLAKTRGPVALGHEVSRIRMVFKFGHDQGLLEHPIRYGQSFTKPSKKVLRKSRAESGSRMFEAAELRQFLDAAKPSLKAMILLAANAGFGQSDIANLPLKAVDLERGWVTFPRPKTGIERRAKLWKETIDALREVLKDRPQPKDEQDAGLLFLTEKGKRWLRPTAGDDPAKWTQRVDLIGLQFSRLAKSLDINGRRGFYAIRHSFQTAAEGCRDFPAIRHVMGHSDASMSATYRDRIEDDRLEAVAATVRAWLFGGVQ